MRAPGQSSRRFSQPYLQRVATYILVALVLVSSVSLFLRPAFLGLPGSTPEPMRQDITPRGRRLLPAESQVAQVTMYTHDWDEEKHTLVVVGTPDDEVEAALSWVRQHLERFNVIEVPTHSRTPQAMMMYANAHYLGDDHGVTWYPDPHGQLLDAMRQRRGVHVQVANDHNRMVEFFEVHPVTREKSMIARLAAGERQAVEVSLWHSMEAVEEGSAIQLGSKMFADPGTFTARSPSACNYMLNPDTCKPKLPPFPTDPRILASRAADHVERKRMMADQPGQIKFYTKYGFKKRRVPEDVFRFMKTYFELNKLDYETEAWDDSNIYTNQFEANSLMVPIPEGGHHKRKLFAQVQTILEEWSGVALEPTAMYGVRIYPRNCKLEMHCDRPETHIVSAIINVSQDVDEPWPVRVKDHFGEEHDVAMEPGDMVLYEGATCAHGRPDPLNGRYFANVFVHFRPVGYTFRPS